jgi:sigma-B regulation protein RsbU (phosphoserine phosphatase)
MKKLSECRVLLVDDAKANLDILVEGLKADHKLSLALNGQIALQIAARTPPDLVLLDIVMPGMDGYEVCRRLRLMPETAEVPIMFLSSLEEVQNKTRGFEAGANDYLTKPFEMLEVKARVRSLLKAKAYSDAVKEQMASELRVAREIQRGMLPQEFSELERNFGVEVASVLEPAREVGGDLFCAFAAEGDRLVLVMGDVSGKGIPASLFMVRTCTLVRLLAQQIRQPERILEVLNNELSADNPFGMFVTLVCAVFDPSSGKVALANGGQTPPALLQRGRPPQWAVPGLGTALGLEPGLHFESVELTLQPADTLVFYTDGVTEAFNGDGECYGATRLLSLLEKSSNNGVPGLAAQVLADVRNFAHGAPQSDDIAVLIMRAPGASKTRRIENPLLLELRATGQDVMHAVESLEKFCKEHEVPESLVFGVMLALEETASNIVNHAYHHNSHEKFSVAFECRPGRLVIETRDHGPAFNPLTVPPPKADLDSDALAAGGVGLYLARHYLDDLAYAREGNENVLRLTKRLPGEAAARVL